MLINWQRSLTWIIIFAVSLLIYVHLQVSVFQASYSIANKEKHLSKLSDDYRKKKFEVSKLRSLGYLDRKREEINMPLVAPEKVEVIHVPAEKMEPIEAADHPILKKGFGSLMGFIKEAQAKMSR